MAKIWKYEISKKYVRLNKLLKYVLGAVIFSLEYNTLNAFIKRLLITKELIDVNRLYSHCIQLVIASVSIFYVNGKMYINLKDFCSYLTF